MKAFERDCKFLKLTDIKELVNEIDWEDTSHTTSNFSTKPKTLAFGKRNVCLITSHQMSAG